MSEDSPFDFLSPDKLREKIRATIKKLKAREVGREEINKEVSHFKFVNKITKKFEDKLLQMEREIVELEKESEEIIFQNTKTMCKTIKIMMETLETKGRVKIKHQKCISNGVEVGKIGDWSEKEIREDLDDFINLVFRTYNYFNINYETIIRPQHIDPPKGDFEEKFHLLFIAAFDYWMHLAYEHDVLDMISVVLKEKALKEDYQKRIGKKLSNSINKELNGKDIKEAKIKEAFFDSILDCYGDGLISNEERDEILNNPVLRMLDKGLVEELN